MIRYACVNCGNKGCQQLNNDYRICCYCEDLCLCCDQDICQVRCDYCQRYAICLKCKKPIDKLSDLSLIATRPFHNRRYHLDCAPEYEHSSLDEPEEKGEVEIEMTKEENQTNLEECF